MSAPASASRLAWEYDEPVVFTEWGVVVQQTNELVPGLTEELARKMAEHGDFTPVAREVTCEPWRTQGAVTDE